jgi:hypothetical protein
MNDWVRSITVLAVSFAGVVMLTVGLAVLIVPAPVGSSEAPDGASAGASAPAAIGDLDAMPTAIGGTLTVTGDREARLVVDRESTDGQYGLTGDDARIFLGGDPPTVAQMNLDGLSFFPEPDACEVTPGRFNPAIGVASAHIRCDDLADVRDSGVVSVEGILGVAGDVVGMRGDLPSSGGTATVGEEALEFATAQLYAFPVFMVEGAGQTSMALEDGKTTLLFTYDVQTHRVALAYVERRSAESEILVDIPPGACSISSQQIGMVNPRFRLLDMTVQCPAIDLPEVGTVPIDASLIVEEVASPF